MYSTWNFYKENSCLEEASGKLDAVQAEINLCNSVRLIKQKTQGWCVILEEGANDKYKILFGNQIGTEHIGEQSHMGGQNWQVSYTDRSWVLTWKLPKHVLFIQIT